MATRAASVVGQPGPAGPEGPAGSDGSPGAIGPSGQAATPASATPGTSPTSNDCDVVWPPGAESLNLGSVYAVEFWITCERTDTKARRHFNARIVVVASLGGALTHDGTIASTTITGPGWTQAAAVAYSVHTTAGGLRKVRVNGSGPSGVACNWIVSGAYVRQQSGLTA